MRSLNTEMYSKESFDLSGIFIKPDLTNNFISLVSITCIAFKVPTPKNIKLIVHLNFSFSYIEIILKIKF